MTNMQVLIKFIEAINNHDVEGILKIITKDHIFIDSLGQSMQGAGAMKIAWVKYFDIVPDYEITIHEVFEKENIMVIVGKAKGTYAESGKVVGANKWETTAAWRAVISTERIAQWQVFADNEPIRRVIRAIEEQRTV
jgi:ketosteroid isomerase-like protein